MLKLEQIIEHYPPTLHPFRGFILREYLQYKILEIIARSPLAYKLSFLGGTALRIVYGNERFSEDIDFDNFGLTRDEFSLLVTEVQNGLTAEGVVVEVSLSGKEAMRCDVRFPGLLFEAGLSPLPEQKILLQIDTLAQGVVYEPDIKIINKFDVFANLRVTPKEVLLAQKLHTCINRHRPKGRDFFDVVFLLAQNTVPDYHYLTQKLSISNEEQLRAYILDKTKDFDFVALVNDVERFLFHARDAEKILQFREIITHARFS